MTEVIKISKPGNNVLTAPPEDLYLDTDTPLLKVAMAGAGSTTFLTGDASGAVRTATITHSLGYYPVFQVQMQQTESGPRRQILGIGITVATNNDNFSITSICHATSTTVVITSTFSPQDGNPLAHNVTYNYYYYIFYDQGSA